MVPFGVLSSNFGAFGAFGALGAFWASGAFGVSAFGASVAMVGELRVGVEEESCLLGSDSKEVAAERWKN